MFTPVQTQFVPELHRSGAISFLELEDTKLILLSSLCWAIIRLFLKKLVQHPRFSPKASAGHSVETQQRVARMEIMSFLHSTTSSVLSLLVLSGTVSQIGQGTPWAFDSFSRAIYAIVVGFFLVDIYDCIKYWEDYSVFVFHHGSGIIIFSFILFRRFWHYEALFFISWEISTIFLTLLNIFRSYNMQTHFLYLPIALLFASTFFIVRIVLNCYFVFTFYYKYVFDLYQIQDSSSIPLVYIVYVFATFNLAFTFLNIHWLNLIVKKLARALNPNKTKKTKQN